MKRVAALVGMAMLVMSGCGQQAEPGKKTKEAPEGPTIGGFQTQIKTMTATNTQETRVIFIGKGSSSLALYIYDQAGNCVAHDDKATPSSKDDLAVAWLPHKGEVYTQELVNLGSVDNPYSPTKGPIGRPGFTPTRIQVNANSHRDVFLKFKGGERACVFVEGDYKPPAALQVEVFDPAGKLVTKDGGGDLCVVLWYPPEEGKYKVRIYNPPNAKDIENIVTVLVK